MLTSQSLPGASPNTRPRRQWSIRSHLVLLVLSCWIPLAVLLALAVWHEMRRDRAEANEALHRSAQAAALGVELLQAEYLRVAKTTASRLARLDPRAGCERSLEESVRVRPGLHDVAWIDAGGAYVCSARDGAAVRGSPLADAALARRAMASGKFAFGAPQRTADGHWVTPLAFPILLERTEFRGTLLFLLKAEAWTDAIAPHVPVGAVANVVGFDGTLLARHPHLDSAFARGAAMPQLQGAAGTAAPQVVTDDDGRQRLFSSANVASVGSMQVGLSTHDVAAPILRKAAVLTAAALALLAAAAFLSRRIASDLTASIRGLSQASAALREHRPAAVELGTVPIELAQIAQDVHRLSRAIPALESAMHDTEERYRKLVEYSPQPIAIHSILGTAYANPALAKFLRLPPRLQLHKRDLADFVAEDERASFTERIDQLRQHEGESPAALYRFVGADGTPLFALHACSSHRHDGGIVVQSHLVDVTAQKAVEADLQAMTQVLEEKVVQRTAQLKAANDNLSSFAHAIAHDLRAPIGSALGFATALKHAAQCGDQDKVRHYASRIEVNTRTSNEMIDGMLRFSHAGSDQLRRGTVGMTQLVEDVLTQLGEPAMQVLVSDDLGEAVADVHLMRSVWLNLISNAVKFSARSAQPRVVLSRRETPQELVFSVSDNGVGFSPADAARLFAVFSRLPTATDYEGTGIGLATVKRIVDRHGGRVWAEGEEGVGATFSFSLPR